MLLFRCTPPAVSSIRDMRSRTSAGNGPLIRTADESEPGILHVAQRRSERGGDPTSQSGQGRIRDVRLDHSRRNVENASFSAARLVW